MKPGKRLTRMVTGDISGALLEDILLNIVIFLTFFCLAFFLLLAIVTGDETAALALPGLAAIYFGILHVAGRIWTAGRWRIFAFLLGIYLLLALDWSLFGYQKGIALAAIVALSTAIPVITRRGLRLWLAIASIPLFLVILALMHLGGLYMMSVPEQMREEPLIKIIEHGFLSMIVCILTIITILAYRRQRDHLERLRRRYEEQANTDALTRLLNRRAFDREVARNASEFTQFDTPCALMLVDADFFKKVNDEHGHAVGDAVLVHIADKIRHSLRESDVQARIGGEEFAVLLPNATPEKTLVLAERLRACIGDSRCVLSPDLAVGVTVSIGVAAFDGNITKPEQLFVQADAALYSAKQQGRDRVVAAWQISAWGKQ